MHTYLCDSLRSIFRKILRHGMSTMNEQCLSKLASANINDWVSPGLCQMGGWLAQNMWFGILVLLSAIALSLAYHLIDTEKESLSWKRIGITAAISIIFAILMPFAMHEIIKVLLESSHHGLTDRGNEVIAIIGLIISAIVIVVFIALYGEPSLMKMRKTLYQRLQFLF